MENARSLNVKRLQNDLNRIAKKEIEFAQKLVEEMIPVRVSWNEDAVAKMKETFPLRIEPKVPEEPATSPAAPSTPSTPDM